MSNEFSELTINITKQLSKTVKKEQGIFITPKTIIKKLIEYIKQFIVIDTSNKYEILEPSCGTCEIVKYIDELFDNITIDAIENNEFIFDKIKNISFKNKYYGEYTFHYWFWKNMLNKLKNKSWIGFCAYRRFWANNKNLTSDQISKEINFSNFNKFILKEAKEEWKAYDTLLGEETFIDKNIKLSKVSGKFILFESISLSCSLASFSKLHMKRVLAFETTV
jgi:uncharacterized cysteine cluster protein YcgN (CxxCxxCC family)